MLINTLSLNEKKAFLGLMQKVISTDGNISKIEKVYFDTILKSLKIKNYEFDLSDSIEFLCNKFKSRYSKIICLLELLSIAWVDNTLKAKERKFILNIFKNFKIDKLNFNNYSIWAKNSVKLDLQLFKFLK